MAYARLEIHPRRFRLGLPDSDVQSHAGPLREGLTERICGAALVLAPIDSDGHPDHDVTGRIAQEAAKEWGVPLWRYAVWAHLHPERITQGCPHAVRLPLDVRRRKQQAIGAYQSQFHALGPLPEDGPVLPDGFRKHFEQPWEFLWPSH